MKGFLAPLFVAATSLAGVADYLSGAELQCEDGQLKSVAVSIRILLTLDEGLLRSHEFPDYAGAPVLSLEEFLQAYFVPDSQGAAPGPEAPREVTDPEAGKLLRGFYGSLAARLRV